MVHLRIVAPHDKAKKALELLKQAPSACNVIYLEGAAHCPDGDVILTDIVREEASVIVSDLKELEIHKDGSIAIDSAETHISDAVEQAEREAPGAPNDAVVWEEVEAKTSEESRLSRSFLEFMVLAALLAAVALYSNSPVLLIGAMVVGPEFGPIAAFCVALVERRFKLAWQSFLALAVGLPIAITAAFLATVIFRATGLTANDYSEIDRGLISIISDPNFFSAFVALCAGAAGVLSLSTAKSGALIGVLISVTTIPAAAGIGIAAAYGNLDAWLGAQLQLGVNVVSILAAGTATLYIQRRLYRRRRLKHLSDPERAEAGLPLGHSARKARSASPATTRPRASS